MSFKEQIGVKVTLKLLKGGVLSALHGVLQLCGNAYLNQLYNQDTI